MKLPQALNERELGAVAVARVVMDRLTKLLDEESAALENRSIDRHAGFTERKNQLLRELMLSQKNVTAAGAVQSLKSHAAAVRAALLRNQKLLKTHIEAVREVSAIIVDSIRQAESDGTYSRFA
jgi:flagellar biosynthesis/type III secretory pathway chaperone